MPVPMRFSRKLESLEKLIPKQYRLPIRYYGQRTLGALEVEMRYLPQLVDSSHIAIDVGANKGVYSYALAKYVKHVYCFEPISELCDYLGNYKTDKLTIINSALSDGEGRLVLNIPKRDGRQVTTRASLVRSSDGELREVNVERLDSHGFENVGFIKIDVEGAEEKVVIGAIETIKRYKPVLLIEMFYTNYQGERCSEIFNFLVGLGYKPILITSSGPVLCDAKLFSGEGLSRNIIFVPDGHRFLANNLASDSGLDEACLRNLHGREYVIQYERKPISRLQRLRKYFNLKPDSVVVDFACGNAMLLEVVRDSVKEYHGVDFSAEMIAAGKGRVERLGFKGARFYQEDIRAFSEENISKFDAAFAMDFSEHVYDQDWIEILRAMRKTLKAGGVLYLHTPNGRYFIEILKSKGVLRQFPEHVAVRTAEHNLRLLHEAGFQDVSIKSLPHYELRQKPFALLGFLPLLGKYFKARIFIRAAK